MADIKDPENTIIITLKDGPVVIELLHGRGAQALRPDEGTGAQRRL